MIFLLILTGVLVGVISSFFGVGGGVLIVPSLYALFTDIPPQYVIGTSLTLICINSALNTYNFKKAGKSLPQSHFLTLSICMMIGVLTGGKIIGVLSPKTVKIFFGVCLLLVSLRTLLQSRKSGDANNEQMPTIDNKFYLLLGLSSLAGGLISGMTGLGGGAILVPMLITVVKLPFKQISMYSNMGMFGGTLAGAISYMLQTKSNYTFEMELLNQGQVGSVNLMAVGLLFIGSFTTSKLGVKLNSKANPKLSKQLFGGLLLFIATRILLKTLSF